MEKQAPPVRFSSSDEPQPAAIPHSQWLSVRRPRRGRLHAERSDEIGPYETSYSIASGYPDREIVLP